jgi:hypothetical protein
MSGDIIMDWTALTAAVDFTDAITFIGAVAVALGGAYVVRKGIRFGLSMIGR